MRFLSLGECMVELSALPQAGHWQQGIAGDTLNTAWYARMQLPAEWAVGYATVLGQDRLSDEMVRFIEAAGLESTAIWRHPDRMPGLYMIALAEGERSFTYWRDRSAARTLADDPVRLRAALQTAEVIYVSGITLAILTPDARAVLLATLAEMRVSGKRVVFDPNLRPRLWVSEAEMCAQIMALAAVSDIVLPSHEDEAKHFKDASPQATAERYLAAGVGEVVVKNGGGPMVYALRGAPVAALPPMERREPVDTTGAGDSFNAGYLAARLCGAGVPAAVAAGHALAMRVIGHRGALMPMPERA
ncbi:sugar kinase [Phaeovulum sp. W22_SRMD_FR3]|uniref:sugar kinase n=1 Tax=Phaeovulum sp. W22_SRMD_FR3 TaxID=3240274 RepID=UPI003F9747AD